ncbi:MAG: ABC transporter ATP-binding protein [Aristaeellaceae bacterium]
MSILEVEGLSKTYPAFTLADVSFALEEGRITGFIGRNGAGKTTTLKALLGFVHPDGGRVRFFGRDFADNQQAIKQDIGYVAGGISFYPGKRLGVITGVTRSFYPAWDDAVYRRCLQRFRLDEGKTPAQLSEGMKVKYALTLALSHHARLLLLDEPTSGLDPVSRDELLDELLALNREGATILFSTHITSDLDRVADDILYIQQGRLKAHAPLREFTGAYRGLTLGDGEYAAADKGLLIGPRREKEGWTALIRASEAGKVPGRVTDANLETVMIHLEKEADR